MIRAAYVNLFSTEDPVSALSIGDYSPKPRPQGWVRVQVKAAALNHHDLWTLKGTATAAANLPIVLGSDAAGLTDDGREVIVYAVIGEPVHGDETLDPKRSLLSEVHDGTLADEVWVPSQNLVAKPDFLTWEQAACLPTAWLTAYRMLFTKAELAPGDTVLVQGASGGVSTALIQLANAAGFTTWVTSRDERKRSFAKSLGAHEVFEPGAKLPGKVDAVMESVGEATWAHSLRALRPGGRIIVCGATTGPNPPADLNRVFFLQLSIVGSTMGTRSELESLVSFLGKTGIRPTIQDSWNLDDARKAFELMHAGTTHGKLILIP